MRKLRDLRSCRAKIGFSPSFLNRRFFSSRPSAALCSITIFNFYLYNVSIIITFTLAYRGPLSVDKYLILAYLVSYWSVLLLSPFPFLSLMVIINIFHLLFYSGGFNGCDFRASCASPAVAPMTSYSRSVAGLGSHPRSWQSGRLTAEQWNENLKKLN